MSATSGPRCPASSPHANPLSLLENRLRAELASLGSMEYKLTWKQRTTPSGRQISALRASAPRTFGSGSGGWPTTTVQDATGSRRHGYMNDGRLRAATKPRRKTLTGHAGTTLTDAANLAGSGPATISFPAATGSRAVLNPAHSRWLMGYPTEWDSCVATVTPLSRKSRQPSSDPT